MASRTRELQEIITEKWDILTPRDAMQKEVERVFEEVKKREGLTKIGGFVIPDPETLKLFSGKVPIREDEFSSPEARLTALEIGKIIKDMGKQCALYTNALDVVSKRTEQVIQGIKEREEEFVIQGATVVDLEGFQTEAKRSITLVTDITKGLKTQVVEVVLPKSQSLLRGEE